MSHYARYEDDYDILVDELIADHDNKYVVEVESSKNISCITPGNPYIFHCFPAHKTGLTTLQHKHLNLIAGQIERSFRGLLPIKRVTILGHAATWKGITKSEYARRAMMRAQNTQSQLQGRLAKAGVSSKVTISVEHRADNEPLVNNMTSSSSPAARNNRALNRRVEIYLIASAPNKRKLNRTVQQNQKFGQSLGWKAFRSSIVNLLGFTKSIPNERKFAIAVAQWQLNNGILTLDGIINKKTLKRMLAAIRKVQIPKNQENGPVLDYGKTLASKTIEHQFENSFYDEHEDTVDPFVIDTKITPEGHERLTRAATVGFTLLTDEKKALRRGVRRVDDVSPSKHFDEDQQARHALRRTKCQQQQFALDEIRSHLTLLHREIISGSSRLTALEFVGEALHLIQDSYSEAHFERHFSKPGGHHPVIWIRFFGFKGSLPFPLEHLVFPPPDPRDIITTPTGRLVIWAREAVSASQEYLEIVLSQLVSSISGTKALEELDFFMDKHLTLSKFHVRTNSRYTKCP